MTKAEVLYCYHCGKRVSRDAGRCLYCSTPTRRTIRPARHCPFCDEEIGYKAVKCPHCGEFLDGRPKEAAAAGQQQGNQQVFFIIDKAIIQGDQPLMLEGGGPVPPEVAQRLSQQTLKAIQRSNPALLDQQGIRALPAPVQPIQEKEYVVEGNAVLDVVPKGKVRSQEVREEPAASREQPKPGKAKDYLPVRSSNAVVPVEQPEEQQNLGTQFSRALVRGANYALAKAGSFAVDVWAGQKGKAASEPKVEDPEDRYRQCTNCSTEVLRDDIFCFHCGVVLRPDAAPQPRRVQDTGKPTFGILTFALILMGLMVFGKGYIGQYADVYAYLGYAIPTMAIISLLLIISAFFRKRTSFNQIVVILFLVLWAAAVIFGVWLAG